MVIVKKIGGSLAVMIPRPVALESKLSEGLAFDVSSTVDGILLRARTGVRSRRFLKKIVSEIDPASYRRRNKEMRDPAVGKEIG